MFVNMRYVQAPDGAVEKERGGKRGGLGEWAQRIERNSVHSVIDKSMA